jgi:hypothetical protein
VRAFSYVAMVLNSVLVLFALALLFFSIRLSLKRLVVVSLIFSVILGVMGLAYWGMILDTVLDLDTNDVEVIDIWVSLFAKI